VPGEAAAALVLGRGEQGALGWLSALTSADGREDEPGEDGIGTLAAALVSTWGPVAWVDGAARARPDLDAGERAALGAVVGPEAPLSATAAAMGALGAAAGAVRAIVLAELLGRGVLPPIAGLERPAEGPLRPLRAGEPARGRAGLAVVTGAPGLAGAVMVEKVG
jgi:3-oxoacyl-(acyl-carrier-protein) synthase